VHPLTELPALLPDADVVILSTPLNEATRGLADARFLARLKDGALLVNVARGAVVDTEALLTELESGRITAALDVTDPEPLPQGHPLWHAPGVLVSPHVGGSTSAFWPRAKRLLAAQLTRFAAGEPLENVVLTTD
jgi:phosphoglycerate dehydrogenase-like enzyme